MNRAYRPLPTLHRIESVAFGPIIDSAVEQTGRKFCWRELIVNGHCELNLCADTREALMLPHELAEAAQERAENAATEVRS